MPGTPVPPTPQGDVTLQKKDSVSGKLLEGAKFALEQETEYIAIQLDDQTDDQLFNQLIVNLIGPDGKVELEISNTSTNWTEVKTAGEYHLELPTQEGYNFTYRLTDDQKGFIVEVVESTQIDETTETQVTESSREQTVVNSTLDESIDTAIQEKMDQIQSLENELAQLTVPEPVYSEEGTQTVVHELVPEATTEAGEILPAETSNETITQEATVVNQEEIDAVNAQIQQINDELVALQDELAALESQALTEVSEETNTSLSESLEMTVEESKELLQSSQVVLPVLTVNFETKDSLVTDSNGQIILTDLDHGKYVFQEVEAPKGYVFDKEATYPFELNKDSVKPIVIEVFNTPETPETPETPGTPRTPGTPGTPETPGTPGTPETPGTPRTPGTPGTPETPSNPTPGKPSGPSGSTPSRPTKDKDLPATGEQTPLFIMMIAALTALSGMSLLIRKEGV